VGSRNGTFVRNRRVVATDPPASLESGDLIVFGQTSVFFLSPADLWLRVRR
jgi:pSer/pThr/pTyr-binding forkhead associated (FHA) protein